jgi:hypothetical protein
LSRYGISDKVSIFGIFNHNNSSQESVLIAQIIWYFIEGFHYRSNEYPFESRKLYKIYRAYGRRNAYFHKSDKTDRWIEIPFISNGNNKLKRNTLLPCSTNIWEHVIRSPRDGGKHNEKTVFKR